MWFVICRREKSFLIARREITSVITPREIISEIAPREVTSIISPKNIIFIITLIEEGCAILLPVILTALSRRVKCSVRSLIAMCSLLPMRKDGEEVSPVAVLDPAVLDYNQVYYHYFFIIINIYMHIFLFILTDLKNKKYTSSLSVYSFSYTEG